MSCPTVSIRQNRWVLASRSVLPQDERMVKWTVKVDTTRYVSAVKELEKRQLPFVMASALTSVAKDAQAAVQRSASAAFKLRNSWTRQGVRIKPALKAGVNGRIEADVHTDTENRSTGAPDYMGRQEDGGTRLPYGGRAYMCVPTKYLRQMAPGPIPSELRPANLLSAIRGTFTYKNRKGQMVTGRQRLVRGFYFFIVTLKSGTLAIMARYATDRRENAYPVYILTREIHDKKSNLRMAQTVESTVNERFGRQWDRAWSQAYASGLKI
jgi:hypothetical protein